MKFSLASATALLGLAVGAVNGQAIRSTASPASDPVVIVSTAVPIPLAGFEARRRMGIGRFITDSVLRAEESRPLTLVLRAHILGLGRVLDTRSSDITPTHRCGVDVFLNGLRTLDTLDGLTTHDVSGVEFYTPGIVPIQFQRAGSSCPVLLLWSVA
jgi:hypothetical protein